MKMVDYIGIYTFVIKIKYFIKGGNGKTFHKNVVLYIWPKQVGNLSVFIGKNMKGASISDGSIDFCELINIRLFKLNLV